MDTLVFWPGTTSPSPAPSPSSALIAAYGPGIGPGGIFQVRAPRSPGHERRMRAGTADLTRRKRTRRRRLLYGEMEMRRHDRTGTPRGLLHSYGLLSGNGLPSSRAMGWLLADVVAAAVDPGKRSAATCCRSPSCPASGSPCPPPWPSRWTAGGPQSASPPRQGSEVASSTCKVRHPQVVPERECRPGGQAATSPSATNFSTSSRARRSRPAYCASRSAPATASPIRRLPSASTRCGRSSASVSRPTVEWEKPQ